MCVHVQHSYVKQPSLLILKNAKSPGGVGLLIPSVVQPAPTLSLTTGLRSKC